MCCNWPVGVIVKVDTAGGLLATDSMGLPDKAVQEIRLQIQSAAFYG